MFELGDVNEEQEKEEKKTVTVQEPEFTSDAGKHKDAAFRYKKEDRYWVHVVRRELRCKVA